jgi:hypothetical protein
MNNYNTYNFSGNRSIYRLNNNRKKLNTFFPYYIDDDNNKNINLQVFYNTLYNNGNQESLGSSFKYTIPKSIDDIQDPSHTSISERQKRIKLKEFFSNTQNINYESRDENNNKLKIFFILIIIFILFVIIKNNVSRIV